ncbi:MAG TPA: hypothetical protein VFN90_05975 [Gemmatimonadales bacterium]|nr:hypothetical protein [Gemmatimonadales bacterium]
MITSTSSLLLAALFVAAPVAAQRAANCHPISAVETTVAVQYVRRLVSVPSRDEMRRVFGLARVDSTTVVAVTDEALCRKALALVNTKIAPEAPAATSIVLIVVGPKFFARTPGVRVGGDDRQFVLNRELTQVLRDH